MTGSDITLTNEQKKVADEARLKKMMEEDLQLQKDVYEYGKRVYGKDAQMGILSPIEHLVRLLNEQTDQWLRSRVDTQLLTGQVLVNPNDRQLMIEKTQKENMVASKIQVIRIVKDLLRQELKTVVPLKEE